MTIRMNSFYGITTRKHTGLEFRETYKQLRECVDLGQISTPYLSVMDDQRAERLRWIGD